MVHTINRKGILHILAFLMIVFSLMGFSSCGSISGTQTSATTSAPTAATAVKGSAGSGVTQERLDPVGKLSVNMIDIVTFSFTQVDVQGFHSSQEGDYVLELPGDNGVTYRQMWNEDARRTLIDSILRFTVDFNKQRLGTRDTRSFTAYDTANGQTEWVDSESGNILDAAPPIDLGYIVKDGVSYFLITQRDSAATNENAPENAKSSRITFCINMDQAKLLIQMFGGLFYEKPIIAFLGDSVTTGSNALGDGNDDPASAYPAVIQGLVKISVLNSGVGWEETDQTLKRLDYDVIKYDPDIVVINLGLNDFMDKISPQDTAKNLQSIIDLIKVGGPKIFLARFYDEWILRNTMAGWGMSDTDQDNLITEYNTMFTNLSKTNNIDLITNIWDGLQYQDTIGDDWVNPTVEGQKIMAGNIFRALKPYLQANNYLK